MPYLFKYQDLVAKKEINAWTFIQGINLPKYYSTRITLYMLTTLAV